MQILEVNLTIKEPLEEIDLNKIDAIALHHMAKSSCTIWDVQEWHLEQGWRAIGYNFWINKKGEVYKGRGFKLGAGVANQNDHIISIGFEGDYKVDTMPEAQFKSGVECIKYVKSICENVITIAGHNHFMNTECPEKNFPVDKMVAESLKTQLTWDEILKASNLDDAQKWISKIIVARDAARAAGDLGTYELFQFLPELIVKIDNRKR